MYKTIYQFLLWDNCNNNCQFCFLKSTKHIYPFEKRQYILQKVLQFLKSTNFVKGSHILICGGQIFDNEQNFQILDKFFKKIIKLMTEDYIDLLYLNTNLIYENITGLQNLLNLIKQNKLFNRLKFTTSYDLQGRFKTKESQNLFLNNLKYIKQKYNDCRIVVNTILTKKTCEKIINKQFNIFDFMNQYKCFVNLLPYIIYNENLSTSRENIFKTLKLINLQDPKYIQYYIKNVTIQQQKKVYKFVQNNFINYTCKYSQCKHPVNFKRYSKHNTCYCCDLKEVFCMY